MTNENYVSQWGQDKFVDELLNKKVGGFFVDIGAHDGVSISNSIFFEKNRGWRGICVEPNPVVFAKLEQNRPLATNIKEAVFDKDFELEFGQLEGYTEMLSGLLKTYDERHVGRINREIAMKGGKINIIKVKCKSLASILSENNVSYIDFLSIDTEGSEFEVISGIDFGAVFIDVIAVENNYPDDNRVLNFLLEKNFDLISNIGGDLIFRNSSTSKLAFQNLESTFSN